MAAWAVATVPTISPREVAWVDPRATRHELARVTGEDHRHWSVRRTVGSPTAGERMADTLPEDLPGAPPRAAGTTTLGDGSTLTVRPWVEGRSLRWVMVRPGDPVVEDFATFLATLHGTAPQSLAGGDGPVPTAEDLRTERLELLDQAASTGLVPPRLLGRWEEALADTELWDTTPTVVHGRLADEHVLVTADHELAAVMGWSQLHVGDPAEDFAVLSASATPDVLSTVRASYDRSTGRQDERLLERARLVGEMADLPALVKAHARDDREALAEIQSDLSHRSRLLAEAEELDAWE
ncbi:phosphotransferase [Kytococcus sedentarius]|uniref:phosphotransferase n=1 Tax=Kytococcus sedentarius TaxID=1276 RepID=UPI0035BC4054